jgi:hypothetical protein
MTNRISRHSARALVASALLLLVFTLANAGTLLTETASAEINHLLDFVQSSGCDFNRNGTWYDAGHARTHLQDKFAYAKSRSLATADQFIDKIGSRSSFSGKPYRVRCGAQELDAGPWLNRELKRFRDTHGAKGK